MKVRAITDGFYKGARRRAGSEFEFDGEPEQMGKWMEDASAPPSAPKSKASKKSGDTKNAATRKAVDAKVKTLTDPNGEGGDPPPEDPPPPLA